VIPPDVRWRVYSRDGGCIAVQAQKIGPENVAPDLCRDRWGDLVRWDDLFKMTAEHVQEQYGSMGLKAPDDEMHLVTLCWHHGVQGWELSHKAVSRAYLARCYPEFYGAS
jgi:hypothetical protein